MHYDLIQLCFIITTQKFCEWDIPFLDTSSHWIVCIISIFEIIIRSRVTFWLHASHFCIFLEKWGHYVSNSYYTKSLKWLFTTHITESLIYDFIILFSLPAFNPCALYSGANSFMGAIPCFYNLLVVLAITRFPRVTYLVAISSWLLSGFSCHCIWSKQGSRSLYSVNPIKIVCLKSI